MQLEDLAEQMHYLGPSALLSPSDICSKVDAVTRNNVLEVASNLWKDVRDRPVIVAHGHTDLHPIVKSLFRSSINC